MPSLMQSRFIVSAFFCCAALTCLVWSRAYAEPSDTAPPIKAESIVRFPTGGIVCLTQDALLEIMLHSINGEKTKVEAMQMSPENPDRPCTSLNPKKRYKVLSAQYNNPDTPRMGLLEIVGEKAKSANGGWTVSVGAQVVKKP